MTDENGRPEYPPVPDLQPRLDEKREALEAKLAAMDQPVVIEQDPKPVEEKAAAVNARVHPKPAKKGK